METQILTPTQAVGQITLAFDVTNEFVDDILVTAFEPELSWASRFKELSTKPAGCQSSYYYPGCSYQLVRERESFQLLDLDTFLRGLKLFMSNHPGKSIPLDAGEFDANDADSVLQYAIFGELVYG